MTDYIEEMMKTAGVGPEVIVCSDDCIHWEDCTDGMCPMVYPNFTAEKQLEIIKLIGSNTDFYITAGSKWELSALSDSCFDGVREIHNKDFTQALAQLTTELMNAGELNKEKVKEILEG